MTCEILVTKKSGQVVAGTLKLEGSKVTKTATKGYETLMTNLFNSPFVKSDYTEIKHTDDPKEWFKNLPKMCNSSYVRARMK